MDILSPHLSFFIVGMLDPILLKEDPEASQHMSYENIFTYIERMREAPKDLQHIDYEDIYTSMVHHLVEEGLFT